MENTTEKKITKSKKVSTKINKTISIEKSLERKINSIANHHGKKISALFTDYVNSEYDKIKNRNDSEEVKNELVDNSKLIAVAFNQILEAVEENNQATKKLNKYEAGNLDLIMEMKNELKKNSKFTEAYFQYSMDGDKEKLARAIKNIQEMRDIKC